MSTPFLWMRRAAWPALLGLVAFAAASLLPLSAHDAAAAGFIVNALTDEGDAAGADGICQTLGGVCTLRAAIQQINATGDPANTITFQSNYVIQPTGPLPAINAQVLINGLSQSGRVTLDGQFAGSANGLTLSASGSTIATLAISNFALAGIRIEATSNGNSLVGNRIGTNTAGTAAAPNSIGILVLGSNNIIGDAGSPSRNIVSGNNGTGIVIDGGSGNVVRGNYIGTIANGTGALGNNGNGVLVQNGESNTIGDSIAGNVISGNAQLGVSLTQGGAGVNSGNSVKSNIIGLNAAGTAAIANGMSGVQTLGIVANLTVGGTTAADRNVISGNLQHGFSHKGGGGANVLVQGNYIGTSLNGLADLGNGASGVYSEGNNLTIGGTAAGAGNVISGNTMHGVHAEVRTVAIYGNTIGLGSDGSTLIGNGQDGILLNKTQAFSTIGSSSGSGRNVVSGNGRHGINTIGDLASPGSGRAFVVNNYVGLDSTGTLARGNTLDGVRLTNVDGSGIGASSGQHNVISSNGATGVTVVGSTNNLLGENRIGTNAGGTADLGNGGQGVLVDGGSANTIGSVNFSSHSLISGNAAQGIELRDTNGAIVRNVYIGTNLDGTAPIPNDYGADIDGGLNNTVGGANLGDRNVISGNTLDGVHGGGFGLTVQGNLIGTNPAGTSAMPNGRYGVGLLGSGATIGGLTANARNVISGNTSHGLRVSGPGEGAVMGNFIGVDITGATALANGGSGVSLDGVSSNQIGSVVAGGGNVISGNAADGVELTNGAFFNVVVANRIGTTVDGVTPRPNGASGVLVAGISTENTIGSLTPGEGNTIAHNVAHGIHITGVSTVSNVILGNSVHSNGGLGIETDNGGNSEQPPPVVTSGSAAGAAGTSSCAFCSVHVYSDSGNEGRNYHGATTTDGAGAWVFSGVITGPNITATVEFPGGNSTEFSSPDVDSDGCSYAEETGANPQSGGDRDPNTIWDFYDVNGDRAIDLADTLLILSHFGEQPGDTNYSLLLDRYAPDQNKPWRTDAATGVHIGIDLQDALVNLQSFGHNCAGPP